MRGRKDGGEKGKEKKKKFTHEFPFFSLFYQGIFFPPRRAPTRERERGSNGLMTPPDLFGGGGGGDSRAAFWLFGGGGGGGESLAPDGGVNNRLELSGWKDQTRAPDEEEEKERKDIKLTLVSQRETSRFRKTRVIT